MTKETIITLIKKLDVTDITGDKVMIDFETGKYFMLKGTAVDIWDSIQSPISFGNLLGKLENIYEVDEATCKDDVEKFLNQLESNKFITLS
ncbi:PqqD family peptide modification chaperone [Butyrivibrio sp. NC3005]|uniref:PqqD family peptide modification chaperone n=1 Tax=Butyrivibrio sp. NC3005 TaxID=1280685 RepID=UPI0004127912|nr:PqqD family peptide modification chaperone [Butyrivibrio sp. NC3005]